MKFRRINVHNFCELVPTWATDPLVLARHLDDLFSTEKGTQISPVGEAVYKPLPFWVEVDAIASPSTVRICTPDDHVNLNGQLIIACASVLHGRSQIELPLNPIFKGYDRIEGTYCVYFHALQTETPLAYVGLTKQRWFDRFAQHVSSARAGSPYLFHRALRDHPGAQIMHKVFMCELDQERALKHEEECVSMFGLYPLGLNMIPGGRAGFAYLSKLGREAQTAEERDSELEQLSARESLAGRPNPLCAARWEADPSFVERVVCGHSGRLTVQQIELIRLGASFGKSAEALAVESGARTLRQVRHVLAGRTYQRIGRDA